MSLGNKEVAALSTFLSPERVSRLSLEQISTLSQQQFAKNDRFKFCRVLVFLLQYDFLYDPISRFTALYLIWDMSKSEHFSQNLFVDYMISYLQDEQLSKLPFPTICMFHSILCDPTQIREYLQHTPFQLLSLPQASNSETQLDWSFAQPNNYSYLPKLASSGINCIVPDEDVPTRFQFQHEGTASQLELHRQSLESVLSHGEPDLYLKSLEPEFLRVAPPLLPCPQGVEQFDSIEDELDDSTSNDLNPDDLAESKANVLNSKIDSGWSEELIWLDPMIVEHEFHWNTCTELSNSVIELRQLIAKALTSELARPQQTTIIQAIKDNPNLVNNLGITPENFPNLANLYPVIAIEIIQQLIGSGTHEEYINALANTEITVGSLEVVNRLAQTGDLPTEFIRHYVLNCISSCESLTQSAQSRPVRLVCLFLQSLFRNKILDIRRENIQFELQSFCLKFNSVREAQSLYRLIKNIEAKSSSSPNTTLSEQTSANATESK